MIFYFVTLSKVDSITNTLAKKRFGITKEDYERLEAKHKEQELVVNGREKE